MKQQRKYIPVLFTVFCLIATIACSFTLSAAEESKELNIIFTHDTHSHINSFFTVENGTSSSIGGFSRIKTLINKAAEKDPETLILDAGDFSMGTLTQTIFSSEAAELRMLGAIGCDVSTLGNHEFDFRADGLAKALDAAMDSNDPLPALVLCNIDWASMEAQGLTDEQQLLKNSFDRYGMKDYVVLTKNNVRIAVFGVFGKDSLACAPTCVLTFKDPIEAAAETVADIKANEDVDIIICLSHSGTSATESKSEDENLAKKVPDIDLIISGHSHTLLPQFIQHGDTYIGSTGEYGKNIGSLTMKKRDDGRWDMTSYELLPVTSDIPPDAPTQEKADQFMKTVDTSYLSAFGYTKDQVLAQNDVSFATVSELYSEHKEYNLGNILSDAFFYTVSNSDSGDTNPVDLAIVPTGCIRDTFHQGDITVEDVYNAYSLGLGTDNQAGYPLISVYLTAEELKIVAEIDATISNLMTSTRLHLCGMNFEFNPHRIPMNRVTDYYLVDSDGNREELNGDRLYRVVCDLYSGQMLGTVTNISYGLIQIQPKYADGTPIENIEDAVITSNGHEIKAWAAIASYLESFEDTDGDTIPNVPSYYSQNLGRKIVNDSKNIMDILKSPNKYSVGIIVIVLVVILILILILRAIYKLIKRLLS